MGRSVLSRIGIASLIMMGSVFLSRLMGIARVMVIAHIGGADASVDAYQAAFLLPEILNHLLASGFLSVTFIPIFSSYLIKGKEAEGWRVFSNILSCFGVLLIIFIVLSIACAPLLVSILFPGRTDPLWQAQAVRMTRIILPAQFCFFAGGLFMAVQFAKERFFLPAVAPLIYNFGIICGGVLLGPVVGMEGFSWGVLAGAGVGNLLIQYLGAKKAGMVFRPTFDFRHPELMRYIRLTLPLMLGLTMVFSTEIFYRIFGSYLTAGSIAVLDYALRIMMALVAFSGQAVGVASYPYLARLAAEGNMGELNRLLNQLLRYLTLVLPVSALLIVLRREVIVILLQHGRFGTEPTELTSRVLFFLMAGAFAFAAQTVVVRGFYAVQNTLLPAVAGSMVVLGSIPLYMMGVRMMGIGGVAVAISLSAFLQVLILFMMWNRYSHNPDSRKVYDSFIKMAGFSILTGFLLMGFKQILPDRLSDTGFTGSIITVCLTGAVFAVLLVAGARLLKISELQLAMERINHRIRERFKQA